MEIHLILISLLPDLPVSSRVITGDSIPYFAHADRMMDFVHSHPDASCESPELPVVSGVGREIGNQGPETGNPKRPCLASHCFACLMLWIRLSTKTLSWLVLQSVMTEAASLTSTHCEQPAA